MTLGAVMRLAALCALTLVDACNAPAPLPDVSGTRPLGGLVHAGSFLYGTTSSGGPKCRDPFAARTYDDGCGVVYALSETGAYRQVYAFDDPSAGRPFGALSPSPDGWLYGGTETFDEAPRQISSAHPILFRVSIDGKRFETLRRFVSHDAVRVDGARFARDGTLDVLTTSRDETVRLYRVSTARTTLVHFFAHRAAPAGLVEAAGSGAAGIVVDRSTCAATVFVVDANGEYRTLLDAPGGPASRNECFRSGSPFGPLATVVHGYLSLNARELIRVDETGARSILARLPPSFGSFIGAPLVGDGETVFALAAHATSPVCLRLLRIEGARVSVIRAFSTGEELCLPEASFVIPRLARNGAGWAFATAAEPNCALQPDVYPDAGKGSSCGAVAGVARDGTLAFVHRFVPRPPVTDGGAATLYEKVSGSSRMLTVTFLRGPNGPQPFALDFSQVRVRLSAPSGSSATLQTTGTATSHRDPGNADWPEAHDAIAVRLEIPDDLPEDMYAISIDIGDGARNALDEVLNGASRIDPPEVFVADASQREITELRARYLGKVLYGIPSLHLECSDGAGNVFGIIPGHATLTGITRATDAPEIIRDPLGNKQLEVLNLAPLLLTFLPPRPVPMRDLESGSELPATDAMARCPTYSLRRSGLWEIERTLSLRPTPDPAWPAAYLRAISTGKVLTGMTRPMVAAAWGYPPVYGTVAKMNALADWNWDGSPFMQKSVSFRHDRVVSVRLPPKQP